MERHTLQLSVTTMLILVVCVALNLWLFRFGPLLGIFGLSVTKHVAIAWLCQVLGVNRPQNAMPAAVPTVPVAATRNSDAIHSPENCQNSLL